MAHCLGGGGDGDDGDGGDAVEESESCVSGSHKDPASVS